MADTAVDDAPAEAVQQNNLQENTGFNGVNGVHGNDEQVSPVGGAPSDLHVSKSPQYDSFVDRPTTQGHNIDDLLTFDPGTASRPNEDHAIVMNPLNQFGFGQEPLVPLQAEPGIPISPPAVSSPEHLQNNNPFLNDRIDQEEGSPTPGDSQGSPDGAPEQYENDFLPSDTPSGQEDSASQPDGAESPMESGTDLMTGSFVGDALPSEEERHADTSSPFVTEHWANENVSPSPDQPPCSGASLVRENNNPFLNPYDPAVEDSRPETEGEEGLYNRNSPPLTPEAEESLTPTEEHAPKPDLLGDLSIPQASPAPDDKASDVDQYEEQLDLNESSSQEVVGSRQEVYSPTQPDVAQEAYCPAQPDLTEFEKHAHREPDFDTEMKYENEESEKQASYLDLEAEGVYGEEEEEELSRQPCAGRAEEEQVGFDNGEQYGPEHDLPTQPVSPEQESTGAPADVDVESHESQEVDLIPEGPPSPTPQPPVVPERGEDEYSPTQEPLAPEQFHDDPEHEGDHDLHEEEDVVTPDEDVVSPTPQSPNLPESESQEFVQLEKLVQSDQMPGNESLSHISGEHREKSAQLEEKEMASPLEPEAPESYPSESELPESEVPETGPQESAPEEMVPPEPEPTEVKDPKAEAVVCDSKKSTGQLDQSPASDEAKPDMDDQYSTAVQWGSEAPSTMEESFSNDQVIKPPVPKTVTTDEAPKQKPKPTKSGTKPIQKVPPTTTKPIQKVPPTSKTSKPPPASAPPTKSAAPRKAPTPRAPGRDRPAAPGAKVPLRKKKDGTSSDSGVEDDKSGAKKTTPARGAPSATASRLEAKKTSTPGGATPERPKTATKSPRPAAPKTTPAATKTSRPETAKTATTPATKPARPTSARLNTSPRTPSSTSPRKTPSPRKEGAEISPRTASARPTSARPGSGVSPALKNVKSKIGSMDNAKHTPGGGQVKVTSQKIDVSNVQSKCGSKDNIKHKAAGGDKKIESKKLEWKVESKVGSLDNAKHKPGGGTKKIHDEKLEWRADSRIGSLDNAQHTPSGGDVKIHNEKLDFKERAHSRVGSLENASHKAGGGEKKIFNEKVQVNAQSRIGSLENTTHTPGGGKVKIHDEKLGFKERAHSRIGSLEKADHKPGGGKVKIHDEKLEFKDHAQSKVGSLENAHHTAGGGHVQIHHEKVDFSERAHSRIGSLENSTHTPSGGDKKIFSEKLEFSEHAQSKVGSLENAEHVAGGGTVQIESRKLDFKDKAHSKVGSKDNITHKAGGGDKKIESHKLDFKEKAHAKVGSLDTPPKSPKSTEGGSSVGDIQDVQEIQSPGEETAV
ncbi:microtubule-associated protein tau isoform X3 [Lingula anatina]|uniref:Microtubule-associated protein n=1 Tax=Lingula anatina TaxID=7574 RepID=A0A1S3IVK9_LINAN|nr:microtubule-associated protein tau isoform X3 [Lingula anatina]|eukprot:XP_013402001.1 microtubule-associated protein tau isoform X3 [Lingula anatina]